LMAFQHPRMDFPAVEGDRLSGAGLGGRQLGRGLRVGNSVGVLVAL